MIYIYLTWLLYFCFLTYYHGDARVYNDEQRLYNYLFHENYSAYGRPVVQLSSPVVTHFGVELMQLISVNERNQYITTKLWVRQMWKNELLQWDPKDFGGVEALYVDAKHVWKPDVVLYNNADDGFNGGTEKYRTLVNIHANGSHIWLAPATFTSTCSMNVKYFPFDIQVCKLQFGSWAFDITKVDLLADGKVLVSEKYINSSEWDIIEYRKIENSVLYGCCPNPYKDITFIFAFRRRPLYFVFNVIAPCVVLMIMVLFSFFLPPESGERISLTITVLLAFAVFLQVISNSLPKNADSSPILSIFYMTVMAESALSLITTCIVLCIHHKGYEKGCLPLKPWVKRWFLDIIPGEIGFKHTSLRRHSETQRDNRREIYNGTMNVYEVIHKINCNDRLTLPKNVNELSKCFDKMDSKFPNGDGVMVRALHDILFEVNKIYEKINEQEKQDEIAEDWKVLGKVIDRLFFYMFLLTFLLSALGTILPVYLRDDY